MQASCLGDPQKADEMLMQCKAMLVYRRIVQGPCWTVEGLHKQSSAASTSDLPLQICNNKSRDLVLLCCISLLEASNTPLELLCYLQMQALLLEIQRLACGRQWQEQSLPRVHPAQQIPECTALGIPCWFQHVLDAWTPSAPHCSRAGAAGSLPVPLSACQHLQQPHCVSCRRFAAAL